MRSRPVLLLSLVLLAFVGLGIGLLSRGTGTLHDFGLNFTSEMVGAIITVFVVNELIKQRDAVRLVPYRRMAYQEMAELTNQFLTLLFSLYEQTIPDAAPPTVEGFLRGQGPTRTLHACDLLRLPRVVPAETLSSYLSAAAHRLRTQAGRIIERFSLFTDPRPIGLIYSLFEDGGLLTSLERLEMFRREIPTDEMDADPDDPAAPRPSEALAAHLTVPDELYWERLLTLYQWLERERDRLSVGADHALHPLVAPGHLLARPLARLNLRLPDAALHPNRPKRG